MVGLTGAHRVVVMVCVCYSGRVGLRGAHRFGQADFVALTPLCANAVFPVV